MADTFEEECARLYRTVDPQAADKAEWERTGGAVLDRAASLAEGLFKDRNDFTLVDVDSDERERRDFALATTGGASIIAMIHFNMDGSSLVIWADERPQGKFRLVGGKRHYTPPNEVNEEWLRTVFSDIMSRIERR